MDASVAYLPADAAVLDIVHKPLVGCALVSNGPLKPFFEGFALFWEALFFTVPAANAAATSKLEQSSVSADPVSLVPASPVFDAAKPATDDVGPVEVTAISADASVAAEAVSEESAVAAGDHTEDKPAEAESGLVTEDAPVTEETASLVEDIPAAEDNQVVTDVAELDENALSCQPKQDAPLDGDAVHVGTEDLVAEDISVIDAINGAGEEAAPEEPSKLDTNNVAEEEEPQSVDNTFSLVYPVVYEDDFDAGVSSLFDTDFTRFLGIDDSWSVPMLVEKGKPERDTVLERLTNPSTAQFSLQNLRLEQASRALSLNNTLSVHVNTEVTPTSPVNGSPTVSTPVAEAKPEVSEEVVDAVEPEIEAPANRIHARTASSRYVCIPSPAGLLHDADCHTCSSSNSKSAGDVIFDNAACPGTPVTEYSASPSSEEPQTSAAVNETPSKPAVEVNEPENIANPVDELKAAAQDAKQDEDVVMN